MAAKKRLNGSQILFECLLAEGVDTVFGYPGGAVLPIYDTMPQYKKIRHILVRHEQGAAFAAEGYARVTGKPGVCFATSGPGATNLVTGIANAYLDSIPVVYFTGQVPLSVIGTDAFQEIDIAGISIPITKHNYLVDDVKDLARVIKEAFHIATHGRPGPVLIDLPKDVQVHETEFEYPKTVNLPGYRPKTEGSSKQVKRAISTIAKAKKPLIIAGHGVLLSDASKEFVEFVDKYQIPVVNTILGLGSIPEDHPLALGMLGMHGHAVCNYATHHADLIIGLGERFDDRITGDLKTFAKGADIIHIDIDPAEIGKNTHVTVPIVGDCKKVLKSFNKETTKSSKSKYSKWMSELTKYTEKTAAFQERKLRTKSRKDSDIPRVGEVVQAIRKVADKDAIFVTDVGQHQMFAAQNYHFSHPNTIVTSGGLGSMGFALPAAMGAKLAKPNKEVWVICGDGGFQMNIQELQTLIQDKIDLKIVISNNGFLGMVRQWQDLFYKKQYIGTPMTVPNIEKLSDAYGHKYVKATTKGEILPALEKAKKTKGTVICECITESEENVFPMVPSGKSLEDTLIG
ncbi:biosynthetic-type acetolactate synthase large subunit [Patescibacteria group bacterium]